MRLKDLVEAKAKRELEAIHRNLGLTIWDTIKLRILFNKAKSEKKPFKVELKQGKVKVNVQ